MSWKASAFVKEITNNITQSEKLVLLVLADYHHTKEKAAWPSLEVLAEECLVTKSGLCRILSRLEKKQFLVRDSGGGRNKRTTYSFIGLDLETVTEGHPLILETVTETVTEKALNSDRNSDPTEHAIRKEPVLELEPVYSPSASDDRKLKHQTFKELIFKCYNYLNDENPPWDGSDAKQLDSIIKSKPDLTPEKFHDWLISYAKSENINPAARPRVFLTKISDYAAGPLNKFGRPDAA